MESKKSNFLPDFENKDQRRVKVCLELHLLNENDFTKYSLKWASEGIVHFKKTTASFDNKGSFSWLRRR